MSQPVVLAKLTAAEGKRDDLVAVLSDMVAHTHNEPGTLLYALHTSKDDDTTVWFYERYADEAALAEHSGSDTMKQLGPRLAGLIAGRPELIMLNDVVAKGI
jgi:quinol monooxygenase YgiN